MPHGRHRPIRLTPLQVDEQSPRRLHPFPGRALAEQDLDRWQRYMDQRCDPLLAQAAPGVVQGLQASMDWNDGQPRLLVQPGSGLDRQGRVVSLFFPLSLDWQALPRSPAPAESAGEEGAPDPLSDGFYLLALRRGRGVRLVRPEARACRRDEPSPLADSRYETLALPFLHPVHVPPAWLDLPEPRAINRLLASWLAEDPFPKNPFPPAGVPLAVVKVRAGRPVWFDPSAGRLPARRDAVQRALRAHYESVLAGPGRARALPPPDDPPGPIEPAGRPLDEALGLDYLPAAGPFPPWVDDIPGHLVHDPEGARWSLPRLSFAPGPLRVELMPVASSDVPAILARHAARAPLALTGRAERLRLLVAVDDAAYRPDLLDRPDTDAALEAELERRSAVARADHAAWAAQWQRLFGGLDDWGRDSGGRLTDPAVRVLRGLRHLDPHPAGALPGLSDEERTRIGLDEPVPVPPAADGFLRDLIAQRRARLAEGEPLPPPWSLREQEPSPGEPGPPPAPPGDDSPSLHRQRLALQSRIRAMEETLADNFELLDELSDFLGLQRQQLDLITVSFSALAGGVAGDGSGLNLMRWTDSVAFEPKPPGNDDDNA